MTDASMWPLKTYFFLFGFVGACALSMVYPIVGIANYMMVYMINPNWWWWGKPLESFGIRYSMTAALCLFVGMLVSSARIPKSRSIFGGWLILLIMFTIVIATSGIIGDGLSGYGTTLIDKTIKMTIFLYCFVRMGGEKRNFRVILWTLVIGTLLIGNDAYHANMDQFVNGRLNSIGGVDFRDSSGLGAFMVAMLPLTGIVLLTTRRWWKKPIIIAAGVLAVNTIIQCRTRSAFIGLGVACGCGLLMVPRGVRLKVYGSIAVAALGAFTLTDGYFWERMNTLTSPNAYSEDSAIQARMELWHAAGTMFLEHPTGIGVGQFKFKLDDYNTGEYEHAFKLPRRVTHNTFLLCATELGFQGLLIFIILIITSLWKVRECLKLADLTFDPRESRLLANGCFLSLVSYLAAATFTDRLYTESLWWVMALPVALQRALHREAVAICPVPDLTHQAAWVDELEEDFTAGIQRPAARAIA